MANINIEIPDEVYKKVKLDAIMQDKTAKDGSPAKDAKGTDEVKK